MQMRENPKGKKEAGLLASQSLICNQHEGLLNNMGDLMKSQKYEVVATTFGGRQTSCQNSRLAICLYWAKEKRMVTGDEIRFKFYQLGRPIHVGL